MKLGFDIDGIIANLPQSMVDFVNEKYNLNHTVDVFEYFDVSKCKYVDDEELNREIINRILNEAIYNKEALSNTEPYYDAVDAMKIFKKNSHELYFITARKRLFKSITFEWFRKHKIPFDAIYVVGPSYDKGKIGRTLNLDFYIDDRPIHLEEMYRYKNRWRKGLALFTRPWNVKKPLDCSKFMRVDKWDDVIRHLGIHNR